MTNILAFKKPADNQPIDVEVTHGDGMFTAECGALHLVTEANTFEALTERVWQLAPDMIEANELLIAPTHPHAAQGIFEIARKTWGIKQRRGQYFLT